MRRISADEAANHFSDLLDRVRRGQESFELEYDHQVVAHLVPASPVRGVKVEELAQVLHQLPDLGDDAEAFAKDVECARKQLPRERDPWA